VKYIEQKLNVCTGGYDYFHYSRTIQHFVFTKTHMIQSWTHDAMNETVPFPNRLKMSYPERSDSTYFLGKYLQIFNEMSNEMVNDHYNELFEKKKNFIIFSSMKTQPTSLSQSSKLVRGKCMRCPWALQRNVVSTIFGIIFLFLFRVTYCSPRMGCPRILELCTQF
jgi:hypothetical protein